MSKPLHPFFLRAPAKRSAEPVEHGSPGVQDAKPVKRANINRNVIESDSESEADESGAKCTSGSGRDTKQGFPKRSISAEDAVAGSTSASDRNVSKEAHHSESATVSSFFGPVAPSQRNASKEEAPEDAEARAASAVESAGKKAGDSKTAGKTAKTGSSVAADVTWEAGKPVPYALLAKTFLKVEETTKRLEITEYLRVMFAAIIERTPEDLRAAVYLTSNKLAPAHEGLELGIGESTLLKALADATGRSAAQLKSDFAAAGDLGVVAQASKTSQRTMFAPPPMTVRGVYKDFCAIARAAGGRSQNKKKDAVQRMLVACRESEARFVIRALSGKLSIGLGEQTVVIALAQAFATVNATGLKASDDGADVMDVAVQILKDVYAEVPSWDAVIPAALAHGIGHLRAHCFMQPGLPVRPMLAKPTKSISEVLDRFGTGAFTCEYKYDGERAQIHLLPDGKIQVFSRNMENHTEKYPDIAQMVPECIDDSVTSFVLDCEAVAYDRETKKLRPFQVLSTRARKAVSLDEIKVHVIVCAFDLLYLNGKALLRNPLGERTALLRKHFRAVDDKFCFATSRTLTDTDEIQAFLEESIKDNCEGLMVKTLNESATYEPSKRSNKWLKVKKDYLQGFGDSLDLVPIGAFIGKGKRKGVYGAYLLACYDPESEQFQSVTKIGTGFSDEQLQQHTDALKQFVIEKPRSYYLYPESLACDVWFEPSQVWEVEAADLSVSPVHKAAVGLVDPSKGIALRFPRFKRVRDDKQAEDATTAEQVAELYQSQSLKNEYDNNDDEIW